MTTITNNKEYRQVKRELLLIEARLIELMDDPNEEEQEKLVLEANKKMDLLIAFENKHNFTPQFIKDAAYAICMSSIIDTSVDGDRIIKIIRGRYQNYIIELPHNDK